MVVEGSRQETLNPGFVLLETRQQGVPVILRELVLPGPRMERNIHLSNSDYELVLNKRDANTNTTANNSVNNTNKSILLKHTNSLPIEEDSNIDFNQQNNQYYEEFQRDRPQSLRPRMVTRSSVNYHQQSKYKLQSNSEQQNLNKINKSYNINNYPILTPYNTRNNSIHQSSDYISLLHSDKPLVTTATTTTITTTTTTATTTTTTILIDNMDSQLLSSSISPEFMGNTSKDTHIDDLLLSNKKLNRTIKYLDNTKLIRRESKSYSTTISPIPLISYHQNVLPNNMDLYPIIMDRNNNNNSTIIDKKFLNNNNNDDNNTNNSSIIKNIKHKLNINKTLNTTKASISQSNVFFGFPLSSFPSGFQVNACLVMQFDDLRNVCPNHFHRLFLISSSAESWFVLSYTIAKITTIHI
ncbi:unnamed protein product [Schistosoma margrebowiei]|uniref:Uncharacterized protein n=1 Tax=Schistosoma margrebowiei TaxID=48269 RepID=A0A183MRB5_9TREM|nr:unnamed protein product [Schistosoma margrebowiei]